MVSVTLFCIALAVGTGDRDPIPMTLLVEGRVAVKVPALWAVQRVTAGPGSARIQVMAPDESVALLVTQAQVHEGETLASTSTMLRDALDEQSAGVFSRFNPDDRRADRPVATYREVRGGRQIDWAVFVDGTVRIAVGCQTPPGGEDALRSACDEAIRSAHAVF
jgi:type VII secretion-associated protein (TIGR03931 family)